MHAVRKSLTTEKLSGIPIYNCNLIPRINYNHEGCQLVHFSNINAVVLPTKTSLDKIIEIADSHSTINQQILTKELTERG